MCIGISPTVSLLALRCIHTDLIFCNSLELFELMQHILFRYTKYSLITGLKMAFKLPGECDAQLAYTTRVLWWKVILGKNNFLWLSITQEYLCTYLFSHNLTYISCINGLSSKFYANIV